MALMQEAIIRKTQIKIEYDTAEAAFSDPLVGERTPLFILCAGHGTNLTGVIVCIAFNLYTDGIPTTDSHIEGKESSLLSRMENGWMRRIAFRLEFRKKERRISICNKRK